MRRKHAYTYTHTHSLFWSKGRKRERERREEKRREEKTINWLVHSALKRSHIFTLSIRVETAYFLFGSFF